MLAMEWRIWCGLRSFPKQPLEARFPPIRDLPERAAAGSAGAPTTTKSLALFRLAGVDPELPFEIGPMNGREVRESGLRL